MKEMAQEKKAVPHRELIETEYQRILDEGPSHGIERDIVNLFRESVEAGILEDRIPMTRHDAVVYEMSFRFGRADIVVFHSDGTASIIEVKDGTKGYNHVVAGIGQAALYACQVAMSKGAVRRVRKCLLWTSTGNIMLDALIDETCESAGVVPLPWQSMKSLMAMREAVSTAFMKAERNGENETT